MRHFWTRFGTYRMGAAVVLVAIAVLALAFVVGFAKAGDGPAAQAQYRVPVCHNGMTIEVDIAAQPAHLEHGDTAGPCP